MGNKRRRRSPVGICPLRDGRGGRSSVVVVEQHNKRRKALQRNEAVPPVNLSQFSHIRVSGSELSCSDDDESSVLSEFDVINDVIQDVLLDSSDSGDSDANDDISMLHAMRPFLFCSVLTMAGRRRRPRKEATVPPVQRGAARRTRQSRGTLLPRESGPPGAPLCVVVDLDETLVAARYGAAHLRPHVKELFDACHEEGCEVVVWSAGTASHVNELVPVIAVAAQRRRWYHHIITRHHRWFREDYGGVKDLSMLGRPLNRVLCLENNPLSVYRQPWHSILVEDFLQPTERDDSLRLVASVVRRVACRLRSGGDVAELLSADSALIELMVPLGSAPPLSHSGLGSVQAVQSRGLRYSPQAVFAQRRYGGQRPLPAAEGA